MTPTRGIRVAIVDDQPAIRLGVVAGLSDSDATVAVTHSAATVDALLTKAPSVDVVILDVMLADNSEPETNVARLRDHGWPVLVYSQDRRQAVIQRVVRAGAMGVVPKVAQFAELALAVRTVSAGEPYLSADWAFALASDPDFAPALSDRERQTLELYASGLATKSVARRLSASDSTVREHLARIRAKYERAGRPANSKIELYARAVEDGYLPPPGSP